MRAFHREFVRAFEDMETGGRRLLEIGCAGSAWLPYFAREFGFSVTGLDYSQLGCDQERQILERAGIRGDVVCADLFAPPPHMFAAFDVVVSMGVVEHFDDTTASIRACSRFLRPGGRIVTEIPNMRGLPGWATRHINRSVYDVHVPLSREQLQLAHSQAELRVAWSRYVLPFDWSVMPVSRIPWRLPRLLAMGGAVGLSAIIWTLDRAGLAPGPNAISSPYIFCVADKLAD